MITPLFSRKTTYAFLFLAMIALPSFAQSVSSNTNDCPTCTCICIQGSVDFANLKESGGLSALSHSTRVGFNLGVFAFEPLKQFSSGQLLLKGGLQFIQKGSKYSIDFPGYSEGSITLGYLEIPLDILYQFQLSGKGGVFAGLGPYFAYGLGGKNKVKFNGYSFSQNSFSDSAYKRFDAGLQITAGYRISCMWSFSIDYEFGFVDMVNSGNAGGSTKNQLLSISVAYCLGKLMHKK